MAAEYHVRIKKDYAVEVIEDLEKKGAIELIEPGADQVAEPVPEWQKEESLRRLGEMKEHPDRNVPLDEALGKLRRWTR
jgi:hypothetical protein